MDNMMDEKDIVIQVLNNQRNDLMNQVTALQIKVAKMLPFMPKEPVNDD